MISFLTSIYEDHYQFIPFLYPLDLSNDNIYPMTILDYYDQSKDDFSAVKCDCCAVVMSVLVFDVFE